ncbi:uncharacterized protein LOC134290647 [Aedes albopictus]|uniref:Uncharacterized protein n=1 Tax=Aedes albopictus TaxID=7160 RepID=A0ABM1YV71_AEDAL
MVDLQSERVSPVHPFLRVGVDYCRPFLIKYPVRHATPTKPYVAIFICLVTKDSVIRGAIEDGTEFPFIPARSPNFGGLWKAAVKSFKGHFKRTIGDRVLQYDEMITVLPQVEAILNSQPHTLVSNDLSDFGALTPGHFLVQRPLTTVPS